MKIFLAGGEPTAFRQILVEEGAKNILLSYYSLSKKREEVINDLFKRGVDVFLDSGGFTVRMRGGELDVKEYGKFLQENKEKVFCYANLDHSDSNITIKNQIYLEGLGLKPLPVFHYDELIMKGPEMFENYCKTHEYVALGGMAGTVKEKFKQDYYLKKCFEISTKYKTKIHGFGITNQKMLERYPFYSADSTSWFEGARYGTFIGFNKGRFKRSRKQDKYTLEAYRCHTDGYLKLIREGAKSFVKYNDYVTRLWEARGIKYD